MTATLLEQTRPKKLFDKPFALSIGPQRSGTSWLDRYLRARGDVCLPTDVKEVFFFDRHYDRGAEFYASHFSPKAEHKLTMEISTTAFDHKQAPERVYDIFGHDVALLCPLRHPIIRSYSLYLHYLRYGIVHGSLKDACEQNPQILVSSRYATHIESWTHKFGNDAIKFVFQETLEDDHDRFVMDVCEALNLPYLETPNCLSKKYNVTTYSKSGFIAGTAQKGADFLRKNKLYFIINLAKSAGLKNLIFGKENPDTQSHDIPADDKEFLQDQLHNEIEAIERLIGPIPVWKNKI